MSSYVGCFFADGRRYYFGRDADGFPVGPFEGRAGYFRVLGAIDYWDKKSFALKEGNEETWAIEEEVANVVHDIYECEGLTNGRCVIEQIVDDDRPRFHLAKSDEAGAVAAARHFFQTFSERDYDLVPGFPELPQVLEVVPSVPLP